MCCELMEKEDHLIKLLLAFRHGEKYFLLFEWADDNLLEFWKTRNVIISPSTESWAAQQCLGIAGAIRRIHGDSTWQVNRRDPESPGAKTKQVFGRHGDLKPENILRFENRGDASNLLVVTDLSETRYHSELTRSAVRNVRAYTSAYSPPELHMKDVELGRSYDIWSLGCVYLEFCLWYLEGYDAVEQFGFDRLNAKPSQKRAGGKRVKDDKFFDIIIKHNKLHPMVRPVVMKVCSCGQGMQY